MQTNVVGPRLVTDAFLPMLEKDGRVVMMSSGAAPTCVQKSSPERQAFFTDPVVTWEGIEACMAEALSAESLEAAGIGEAMGSYGLSKALLNCETVAFAREHPEKKINACTPGMILTDMVKGFVPWWRSARD